MNENVEIATVEVSDFCQCDCGCKNPTEFTIFDHTLKAFTSLCMHCMYTYCKDVIQIVDGIRPGQPVIPLKNQG